MLIELVRAGAEQAPDAPLVLTMDDTRSYADVLASSEALANGLRARSIERFACIGHAAALLPLIVASSAVGAEACMYPADLDDTAVASCAARFDHDVVITERTIDGVAVLHPDELATRTEAAPLDPPDAAPVLILTTGTTGEPRGARHDWRRLAAAVRHPDDRPGARWLLAYNINQFAGVQVLIHALRSRAALVVPPSNQPRDAVAAMRELGVTHASATPTFWRFALGLIDGDTAQAMHLEQITLGGEAVPGPLLDRLETLFPDTRISQVYASNEFGSSVSVKDRQSGLPLSVLDRGDDADVQMRIVDGELHVRSRVGMLGYYGEEDVGDGWRPTGDLVEVQDDRIVFVGRTSEIINVGGVKVHPLPVEELVGGIEGVELVHAYGRKNAVTGQIVAVDVVARAGMDTEELEDRIRDACETLVPAAQPRRIRFVEDIEIKGNKIARSAER